MVRLSCLTVDGIRVLLAAGALLYSQWYLLDWIGEVCRQIEN